MQCCIVIVQVKPPDAIGKMLKLGPLGLATDPNLYNLYLSHLNLHLPGLAVIHWFRLYFLFLFAPGNIRI